MMRRLQLSLVVAVTCSCGARTGLPDVSLPPVEPELPKCVPTIPSTEVCDGVDNDCNGLVDDGMPFALRRGPITIASGVEAEALNTELEATKTGLLAMWRVGFLGESPRPTTRTRVLDAEGNPLATVVTPLTRAQTQGPRATPTSRGDFMLSFCHRVGTEDRMGGLRLSASGNPVGSELDIPPLDAGCGAVEPDAIWTGSRHLFAWVTNVGVTSPGNSLYLHIADEEGASVDGAVVRTDADISAPPRLAQTSTTIAMLAGRRETIGSPTQLLVTFLSKAGERIAEPIFLTTKPSIRPRDAVIAASTDGSFLIAAQNDLAPGMIRARVGSDGRVIEDITELVGGPLSYSDSDLVARGAGFILAANTFEIRGPAPEAPVVFALDAAGKIIGQVTIFFRDEKWGAWPSIAIRDGRVFVLYTATLATSGQEVRLVELGCPLR